jgi:hypothetical protein
MHLIYGQECLVFGTFTSHDRVYESNGRAAIILSFDHMTGMVEVWFEDGATGITQVKNIKLGSYRGGLSCA